MIFESNLSVATIEYEMGMLEDEDDGGEMLSPKTEAPSVLARVLLYVPTKEANMVSDEWVEVGKMKLSQRKYQLPYIFFRNTDCWLKSFRCVYVLTFVHYYYV